MEQENDAAESCFSNTLDDNSSVYKDLFYKAFTISPVLMAISEIQTGKLVDVNQAWLDTLGYRKEEVIGQTTLALNIFVDFEERQSAKQQIIEQEILREKEMRIISKTGEIRHGMFSGDIITKGHHKYLLTTAYDITDRVKMKQIEEKNRKLEQKLKYDAFKSNFFSNISHDLKTPITIIFSSLQLLELLFSSDRILENKDVNKPIKLMKQNCLRLIRLINNIIDLNKADSGYLRLNLDYFNIVESIQKITESVIDYGRTNGVNITFHSELDTILTVCDIEKVERIILNLLSNAIKFTPGDGSIHVQIHKEKSNAVISIRDTGVGIPKSERKHLFTRYYQANTALTKVSSGSGIGLSLAKSFAELHHGDLFLNEEYEDGCEFILLLPIVSGKKDIKSYRTAENKNAIADAIKVEFSDIY
jgi:PAS domain S-box-containing protein